MPDDPFQTSPNFVNPSYVTPQQLLQMRMVAQQLMGPDQQQVMRPAQGWSNLANTLVGTLMNQQANQGQRQMLQQGQNAMTGAAQQNPYAAMLLGGGVPQTQMMPQQGGATSAPGQSPPMQQYAGAISHNESGGNYQALGPVTKTGDRAYGKYQVMGQNIPQWTAETLGQPMSPQQFLQSPQAQDAVFQKKFGQYTQQYGPQGAAKAWFAGEQGMNNPNARDQLGTTISQYAQNFQNQLPPQMQNPPQTMQQAQPNMQMAQNAPQGGQAAMAHMYMDPNVPDQFKTAVQGGQVPQMISDAAGNTYLYKPGMTQPVLVPGLKQAGAPIDVGPGTFKGGVGTLGVMGQQGMPQGQQGPTPPQGQPAAPNSPLSSLNPVMNWANQNAANLKAAESEASKTGETLAEYKGLGVDANQLAGNLDTLKQLGQKVGYGMGPSIQSWLGDHGIPTAGLSDIQAYQRFIPYVGVLLRPQGSGRLMTQELTNFNQSLGGLMTTPQGREIAIDTLSRIAHYKAKIADVANDLSMGPNERMSKINSLPVPPIDWAKIQQVGGAGASTMPTQGGTDPEAMAEARKRGLIK